MSTMVRKQVYLEPRQDELLKQWAEETGKSEAEILRQALDYWLASEKRRREAQIAWQQVQSTVEQRMAEVSAPKERKWTREEIYQECLARHDRRTD